MVRIGIIGVGGIANGRHIPEINASKDGKVTALCDIDAEKLKRAGDKYNIDESHRFENYEDLIACPDVDAVDICTPNYLHCEIAEKAVIAGKAVNIEKPLSICLEKAIRLQEVLTKHPVPNMMCFTYRFMSAVRYAKEILNNGTLGEIININVSYLQSGAFNPGRKLEWRFIKEYAGSGALGDLGVHLLDMALFLFGDIRSVCAKTGTVVKKRRCLDSDEYGDVTVDDYCNFMAEFKNGISGLFNVTKCAVGHVNTIKYEVYGRNGIISFNLNNPDTLDICIGQPGDPGLAIKTITVPAEYRIGQEQSYIDLINGKTVKYAPTVDDGVRCQRVIEAIIKSAESNCVIYI